MRGPAPVLLAPMSQARPPPPPLPPSLAPLPLTVVSVRHPFFKTCHVRSGQSQVGSSQVICCHVVPVSSSQVIEVHLSNHGGLGPEEGLFLAGFKSLSTRSGLSALHHPNSPPQTWMSVPQGRLRPVLPPLPHRVKWRGPPALLQASVSTRGGAPVTWASRSLARASL